MGGGEKRWVSFCEGGGEPRWESFCEREGDGGNTAGDEGCEAR